MRIAGTDMHVVTLLFILCELVMFVYQLIYYLSYPQDKKRWYYLILLLLLILKNTASGLFPDVNLTSIPLVIQYGLAYGAGFLMASYFPYYFYRAFELQRLRWHAIYGVSIFLLVPFSLIFTVEILVTGNIDDAIDHGLIIPAMYGLVLLYLILSSIREKYQDDVQRKQFFEVIAVYVAVTPWASLAFFAFFRIDQVAEALLTNVGFVVITVLFIRRSINNSRLEYLRLQQYIDPEKSIENLSKLELLDETISTLQQQAKIDFNQRFEQNLSRLNLTARERDVARLIREGLGYRTIAEQLHISERTVNKHVQHMFEKLGATNRVSLIHKLES